MHQTREGLRPKVLIDHSRFRSLEERNIMKVLPAFKKIRDTLFKD